MKKIPVILIIIAGILVSAYLFLRFYILDTKDIPPAHAASTLPASDTAKSVSILDIRPALIAKLQQLVKHGSSGLYNLTLQQIEPDILQSRLKLINAVLTPDTAALINLDNARNAPDDVFKISLDSLHISGIGIADMLSQKKINLKTIYLNNPRIEVFHIERSYNKHKRQQNDTATLYQKLMKHLTSVSIDKITVHRGTLINYNQAQKNSVSAYKNVTFNIKDILIDSTTQYDQSRYLFAKEVNISMPDYLVRTPDSLYFFKCGLINISAAGKTLTAKNVALVPRGNKQWFRKKLTTRKDMYGIKIPTLVLSGINWWKLQNRQNVIASDVDIYNGAFSIYLDKSLPLPSLITMNNFPHQILMNIKAPVSLAKVNLHHANLSYAEYDPEIARTGTVYFDDINGHITNVTNMQDQIKKSRQLSLNATALFMHKVPMKANFNFDLAKVNTGRFSVDLQMASMDTAILNPIAEPLGLFTIKTGTVRKATTHLEGDNYHVNANIVLLYNNLHLTPLKKEVNNRSKLKKKDVTGTIANIFLIKNSNPGKSGDMRNLRYTVKREKHKNFFNFAWKTILTGILKTIGVPEKYANK